MKLFHSNLPSAVVGKSDLEKHVLTPKHSKNVQAASTSKSLLNFVVHKSTPAALKVWAAEGALAFHTVMHHNSFKSMDCTPTLLRMMFNDSETAKKISCARTKTEAIISGVFSPHSIERTLKVLSETPFISISTDGSNHGNIKLFPIVVQYFDASQGGIQVKMLELKEVSNEKACTIAAIIEDVLKKHNLQGKLIAFSGDNTNTNFGGINRRGKENIFHLLKQTFNPQLVGVGCPAHVLHNAIHHGLDRLGAFDMDSIVMKIFNFFSIYTVRTAELKEFCDFVDIEYRGLLYHSKTRWLSLMPAVHRILQMFPALKSYFLSQNQPPKVLENFFHDELSECYLLFTHSLMALFSEKIKFLEREQNTAAEVLRTIDEVRHSLDERIEASFLPLSIKSTLAKLRKDGEEKKCTEFEAMVQEVYRATKSYLEKWTEPLSDLRVRT